MIINRIADIIYSKVVSGKTLNDFHFDLKATFLSDYYQTVCICLTYLVVIFSTQYAMQDRKPFKLKTAFRMHNLFLSVLSLVMLVGFLEEVVPMWWERGLFYCVCDHSAFTNRLSFWLYLNYLTKFYELGDTLFLVLMKKELKFLHWYHHAMTAVLCQIELEANTPISWVVVTLNLFVHVVMYYYYYLAAMNVRVWWKKYITVLQITQFIVDMAFVLPASYMVMNRLHFSTLPSIGNCHGTAWAALFGSGLLFSYLVLFIRFFINTYRQPKAKSTERAPGVKKID